MKKLFPCLIVLVAVVMLLPGCIAEERSNSTGATVTEVTPVKEAVNTVSPADGNNRWAGSWDSGNESVTILTQKENEVTGTFTKADGSLTTVEATSSEDGKRLTGNWSSEGKFIFTLSDDGKTFNGTYGYGTNNSMKEGFYDSWNGTKVGNQTTPESGWAGTWDLGYDSVTILTQNENTVKGLLQVSGADETILEGNLSEDGKVLSGTWTESGKISFTQSDDGKVFNGTFGFGSNDSVGVDFDIWNGVKRE